MGFLPKIAKQALRVVRRQTVQQVTMLKHPSTPFSSPSTSPCVSPPLQVHSSTVAMRMDRGKLSNAKINIWWDIHGARLPGKPVAAETLLGNFRRALADAGYHGKIDMRGWSDRYVIDTEYCIEIIRAMEPLGIKGDLYEAALLPEEDESEASSKHVLFTMLMSTSRDKPPCNHMLISGNRIFLHPLYILKDKGYNILIARPPSASNVLDYNIAMTVWDWEDLVEGKPPLLPSVHTFNTVDEAASNGNKG